MKDVLAAIGGLTILAAIAAGVIVDANAAKRDRIVRMIEEKLSGKAGVSIGPGVTITLQECDCTLRYVGTSVTGKHYAIHIDRLD